MQPLRISNGATQHLRGKLYYIHSNDANGVTAFEISEEVKLRILLPRQLGVVSVDMLLFSEDCNTQISKVRAVWKGIETAFDVYEVRLDKKQKRVGLYFFSLDINCIFGNLKALKLGDELEFNEKGHMLQLTVSDFKHQAAEDKLGGIIYHIFVDRFNKGGKITAKDNAVIVDDWSGGIPEYPEYPGAPLKNNRFYGGTLYGIIEKLDYIASLGVNLLYLSPIFDASSNHKYDTADYMSVDSMFGGEEALKALIKAAGEKGIGIILDGVFNHTGADSIYFNKEARYNSVGAYQSKDSKYYSWYDFQCHPNKYTCWWGIEILPRINPNNPDCRAYFVGKNGVIEKYAKMGISGFRLDVADELSDEFISEIKRVLSENVEQSLLYGEVWEDASNKIAYDTRKKYYLGSELDGVMNYPVRVGIIDYLKNQGTDALYYALTEVTNNAPKRIRDMQMNLLGTHDTQRIITTLAGESSEGRSNRYLATKRMNEEETALGVKLVKMAYSILATIPGIPAIFYGDEAGLEGYHDPFNRMPYPWGKENRELIDFYRRLGSIRRSSNIYKSGEFKLMFLDSNTLIYKRYEGKKALITVVNNARSELKLCFTGLVRPLIQEGRSTKSFTLLPLSSEIFEARQGIDIEFN